jgi:O-antigen ligase
MLNGFFVLLYFYVRSKADEIESQRMLRFMLKVGLLCILFGFVEFIAGKLGFASLQISKDIYVYGGRPTGVFREPDWFGGYLVFIIGLVLPFLGAKINDKKEARFYACILYTALFMSLILVVRSAWLGLLVGLIFVLFRAKYAIKYLASGLSKIAIFIICGLVFLSAVSSSHFQSVQDRFISIFTHLEHKKYDPATQVRLNSYDAIISYIKNKPIQGYGAGAWEYLSERHQHVNKSLSTNNLLLTPIFEMGILGIALYLFFMYSLLRIMSQGFRLAITPVELSYVTGIAIAVIGTAVVSIFNDIMLTGFYWAFIAIFNNYITGLKNKNENIACAS